MRAFLQMLLALLLLAAQQQALAHPFVHLHDEIPVQTDGAGDEQVPAASACDLHAVFAQVLGAIDTAAPALLRARESAGPGDGVCAAAGFVARVVAVSRGPPAGH